MPHDEILANLELSDAIALIERQDKQIANLTALLKIFNPCNHLPAESAVCIKCGYPDPSKLIATLTAKIKEREAEIERL